MAPAAACTIDRKAKLSRAEFEAGHLSGGGYPVIVTDAMDGWAARNWSFDFFRERYGGDLVIVTDRLGRPTVARKVRLDEYIRYIETPEESALGQIPSPAPLYCNNYSPFVAHPELLRDFSDPYFVENLYRGMDGRAADWYNQGFGWLFLGPAGTVTPLHEDLFGTHAWLAQIAGRKRFLLYAPGEKAEALDFVAGRGEVVFIPAGWMHKVTAIEPSITLTFNFVDASNFTRHMLAIARDLPCWCRKVDTPGMREAAGIRWQSKGWDT